MEQGLGFSTEGWGSWGQTRGQELFSVSLQGYWVQETRPPEGPGFNSPSVPQHPLWGCFPASPPLSSLASGLQTERDFPDLWDLPKSYGTVRGSLGYIIKVGNFVSDNFCTPSPGSFHLLIRDLVLPLLASI